LRLSVAISTYTILSRCLKGRTPSYDPLYKVRSLIDLCQRAFRNHLEPGRDLSIDKGMIRYKDRLLFRQYMPKKPVKWGIKAWILGESKSGYGKSAEAGALGTRVVLQLSEPFHSTNHNFYFDKNKDH